MKNKFLNLTLAISLLFQPFVNTGVAYAESTNNEVVESVEDVKNLNEPTIEDVEEQEPIVKEEVAIENQKVKEIDNPPKDESQLQLISEDESYDSDDYIVVTADGLMSLATAYVGEKYRISNTAYDFSSIISTWKTTRGIPKLYATTGGVEYTAFCIEPGIVHETGGNMSSGYNGLTYAQREKINQILMYGYGNNGDYSDDSYVATQVAIWEVVANQPSWGMIWGQLVQKYDSRNRLYSNLLEDVRLHGVIPSFMSDNRFNAKETTLTWNGSAYTTTLTDTNGVLSKYKVISDNGDVKVSQSGNKLTLTTTNPNPNVTLRLTKKATTGGSTLYWVSSTKQDLVTGGQDDPVNAYLKINVNAIGTYEILKKSTSGNIIQGAKFRITGNNYDQTFTTDSNGRINATNIPIGKYTVTEVSVPVPYLLDPTPKTIEVKANQTTTVEFVNDYIKGGFELLKSSDDGSVLKNVEFALYDGNNQLIDTLTTDSLGLIRKSGLLYGDYYLVETRTLNNHQLLTSPIRFSVNQNGTIINLTAVNNRTRVELLKVDEKGNPLSGATLQVLKKDGTLVEEWLSSNAPHTILGLAHGEYILHEVSAPSGYMLMNDVSFKVTDEAKTVVVQGQDLPTVTELLKVDENGNPLVGATLQVLTKDGKLVEEWISTDKAHQIVGLAHGEYIFHEVSAPSGYMLMTDVSFTVTDKAQTLKVQGQDLQTVTELLKVDENGNPLVGATLQVLTKDGALIEEWISTDKAHQIVGLAHGEYIFHEVSAPSGYMLMTDVSFTVTDKAQTLKVQGQDLQTVTELLKVDQDGNPLVGATLQVLTKDGKVVEEWISKDTAHIVTGLAHGEYIFHEVSAPSGYTLMTDVPFVVTDEPVVLKVQGQDLQTVTSLLKVDEKGNPLVGATLQILTKDGKVVEEWISKDTAHIVTGLAHGEYIFHEVSAPSGYTLMTDVLFVVTDEPVVLKVQGQDLQTVTSLLKVDEKGNPLVGAMLQVLTKDGKLVEEWISTDKAHEIVGLAHGEYIFHEVSAPSGYMLMSDVPFTVTDMPRTLMVQGRDLQTVTELLKVDENNDPLVGATLQVLKADGTLVDEWVSTDKAHEIVGLAHGEYIFHEVSAPSGYMLMSDVPFTVTDKQEILKVKGKDLQTVTELLKVDENNDPLVGATLQVLTKDGVLVEEWISTDKAHEIVGLAHGEYIFHEVSAPSGYVLMEDIPFTVTDKQEILKIQGQDLLTSVGILKVDENGDPLVGATLQVLTKDGVLVEEWISTDKAHEIVGLAHGEYILHEVSAPSGYVLMEDIPFTVTDNPSPISIIGQDLQTHIEILKVDELDVALQGATLQVLKADGTLVDEWVSTDVSHELVGLEHGEYILHEVSAPSGYKLMEDVAFYVDDQPQTVKVQGQDLQTRVEIDKFDSDGNKLFGATMQIINKATGEVVEEWTTTDETKVVEGLEHGDYILREITAPNGFQKVLDIEFTITDENKVTVLEVTDELTRVEIDKFDSDGNKLFGATMQIINKATGEVVEEWTTTDETKVVEGLEHGDYILREITAPNGFQKILDIEFTVTDDNGVTILEVTDELTKTIIEKVDENGKLLTGAHLQIINDKGEVVREFITDGKAYVIEGLAHGTYTLHEVQAPKGYQLADDIQFTVTDDNGELIVTMLDKAIVEVPQTGFDQNTLMIGGLALVIVGSAVATKKRKRNN
ncbi:LPXTG cell wall anchor domain-containing protein [Turicibacter sanguinis]|nr:LPXTG cell wall anchor domain-containing protein [Turicibacter sanguinis]